MAEDDEEQPDPTVLNRRKAQGAAQELSRMGIDPRSLGLDDQPDGPKPDSPASSSGRAEPSDPGAGDTNGDSTTEQPADGQGDGARGASIHQLRPGVADEIPVHQAGPSSREDPDADTSAAEVPPSAPEQSGVATGLEKILSRSGQSADRTGLGPELLRNIGRGLATPDAAEAAAGERELIESIRRRQVDRRIIAFMSAKGGVGCTSVAIGIGVTLMAMRDDRSAVIDVQQGSPSLGASYGAAEPRSAAALIAETEYVEPPANPAGLTLVDGAPWERSLRRSDIAGLIDRLSADHVFHLADIGNDASDGAHAALARADQVVVIGGPGQTGLAGIQTAVNRANDVNPAASRRGFQVVVCPYEAAWKHSQRDGLAQQSNAVVIGPDPYLQGGHSFDSARVSTQTRRALLRMSAMIAGAP